MFNLLPWNPAAVRKARSRTVLRQEVECSDSVSHICWDLRLGMEPSEFHGSFLTLTPVEIKCVAASNIFNQPVLT